MLSFSVSLIVYLIEMLIAYIVFSSISEKKATPVIYLIGILGLV